MTAARTPWWAWTWPLAAWLVLLSTAIVGTGGLFAAIAGVVLIATVFAAVYHAEVVAHRTGEPFGTLVLALAVTVIETALIVSVMLAAPADNAGLARDTVFAAIMIVCNGIVGLCLLLGGLRHREQTFQLQGASAALAVLAALSVLALVLPNYAVAVPGPMWSPAQLAFSGFASLVLYGAFVFVQSCATATISRRWGRRGARAAAVHTVACRSACCWSRSSSSSASQRHRPRRSTWRVEPRPPRACGGIVTPRWGCCPKGWRRCAPPSQSLQTSLKPGPGLARDHRPHDPAPPCHRAAAAARSRARRKERVLLALTLPSA
jgi:hypothetical protein